MKIKNTEIDFDLFDADNVEKFEKEAQKVKEKCEKYGKENKSYSQAIREECQIIEEFLDNVFDNGISEKIFEGKKNLLEHINVFQDIVNEKLKKQNDLNNTFNRYMPNREQRRWK